MTPENPLPGIFTWPEMGFPPRPRTTSELIQDPQSPLYISPDAHVLIVGPGIHQNGLPMDVHALFLPPYLEKDAGTLTIVDLPEPDSRGGQHNLKRLQSSLMLLQQQNPRPFCQIKYVYADLTDVEATETIRLASERENFDVIIDHLTMQHWMISDSRGRQTFANFIIASHNYARLMGESGKAHVFYSTRDRSDKEVQPVLIRTLAEVFDVADVPVSDSSYQLDSNLLHPFLPYAPPSNNRQPHYVATGVFVCTNPTEDTRWG